MRWAAAGLAAVAVTGCLRDTEFRCMQDSDCETMGHCEAIGFCSVGDAQCATGRRFSESAGQGLASTCVPATAGSAGRCPVDFVAVGGSAHRYKRLAAVSVSWDQARAMCEQISGTYLLVPDDATELSELANITSLPVWIGLDDLAVQGMFMTVKNARATFTPWAANEPSTRSGQDCVRAISATQIATDQCGVKRAAICECEP
jgi:hypothetical protein